MDKQQTARHYTEQSQLATAIRAAQDALAAYDDVRWHVPSALALRLNALQKALKDMR